MIPKLTRWYIAGPLFNPSERAEVSGLARIVESEGFETYVPHENGFLVEELLSAFSYIHEGERIGTPEEQVNYFVFCIDVYNVVKRCGGVIFDTNGRIPDEGGVSEAAIAWTLGLPVILYKSDSRSLILGQDNPLITGLQTFTKTATDEESLRKVLQEYKSWGIQNNLYNSLWVYYQDYPLSLGAKWSQMGRAVRLGQSFWGVVNLKPNEMVFEAYKIVDNLTKEEKKYPTPLSLKVGEPSGNIQKVTREGEES